MSHHLLFVKPLFLLFFYTCGSQPFVICVPPNKKITSKTWYFVHSLERISYPSLITAALYHPKWLTYDDDFFFWLIWICFICQEIQVIWLISKWKGDSLVGEEVYVPLVPSPQPNDRPEEEDEAHQRKVDHRRDADGQVEIAWQLKCIKRFLFNDLYRRTCFNDMY